MRFSIKINGKFFSVLLVVQSKLYIYMNLITIRSIYLLSLSTIEREEKHYSQICRQCKVSDIS